MEKFLVGMADIHVSKGPAQYTCLGLGSCIGLALYCPESGVSGMIHIMLPEAFKDREIDKIGKFADTGIPELLDRMKKMGANTGRLKCAYAGGAQVFKFGDASASKLDVGKRNAEAVHLILENLRLRPVAHDTGGNSGRTVIFITESGEITVRTVSAGESRLCNFKKAA